MYVVYVYVYCIMWAFAFTIIITTLFTSPYQNDNYALDMYAHCCTIKGYKYTLCDVTQLVEKMSRQPAAKTSRQPNKEQELYEHVEMQEQQSHYMSINRPNPVEVEDKSQLAGQISTKVKRGKCVVIALIAVFLVIALVVSLVAVIIYSPLARSGDNTESSASTAGDNMLSRISQLEGSVRASVQGLNVTVANTVN